MRAIFALSVGSGKSALADLQQVVRLRAGNPQGVIYFLDLRVAQVLDPGGRVGDVFRSPLTADLENMGHHGRLLFDRSLQLVENTGDPRAPRTKRPGSAPVGFPSRYVTAPATTVAT